jgi:Cu/Ag efflux protein CusF
MRTLVSVFFVMLVALGCGEKKAGESEEGKQPAAEPEQKKADETASDEPAAGKGDAEGYKVRGEVKGFDEASGQLAIHHEKIPDFKNREGQKVGMMSMQMSFRTAEGVDGKSLAVGDKIEFEFAVEWDKTPPIVVTKVKKLPADTALEL